MKFNLKMLGGTLVILSMVGLSYYVTFGVETLSELAFLLIGLTAGLLWCLGILLLNQEEMT